MKFLGWWLLIVGVLRIGKIWQGFFDIPGLHGVLFGNTTLTDAHGRSVAASTLLSSTLCFLCAFNLDNKPLYLATFLSFFFPVVHFLMEYLIYNTMTTANMKQIGIVAGSTILVMLLQWNSFEPVKTKDL